MYIYNTITYNIYRMVPPVISLFINPLNTVVTSTINSS